MKTFDSRRWSAPMPPRRLPARPPVAGPPPHLRNQRDDMQADLAALTISLARRLGRQLSPSPPPPCDTERQAGDGDGRGWARGMQVAQNGGWRGGEHGAGV